jgi:hypothetical protein
MKQRVVIAAAVLHRPRSSSSTSPHGLDVGATIQVKALIAREAAAGRTILYLSHLLDVVERRLQPHHPAGARRDLSRGQPHRHPAALPGKTLEMIFQEQTGQRAVTSRIRSWRPRRLERDRTSNPRPGRQRAADGLSQPRRAAAPAPVGKSVPPATGLLLLIGFFLGTTLPASACRCTPKRRSPSPSRRCSLLT